MTQRAVFKRSFDTVRNDSDSGNNLANWTFEVNNGLKIVSDNPQIISIIKTNCGGLFKCDTCSHKWTKRSHSTILFQCDKDRRKIECKLFGHICLECTNNPNYHVASYNENEIQDTVQFLRKELLRKLYPHAYHEGRIERLNVYRGYGRPQQYYNVDFANYCESCRSGDYCRLHRRN